MRRWWSAIALLTAAVFTLAGCGLRSGSETKTVTLEVLELPKTVSGQPLNLSEPLPRVAGATIAVSGTSLSVITDSTGQVSLTIPVGVQEFVITPPPETGLKKATYLEQIFATGTDRLGFAVSPERERTVDNVAK